MTRKLRIDAPAKINLALNIVGKRDDGYHLLESVVQAISLSDTIILDDNGTSHGGMDIRIVSSSGVIPCDQRNSAYKAAAVMAEQYGLTRRLTITIEKNIPVCSGLGGESTDAAAVLIGMSQLYRIDLSKSEISTTGASIGSDVPVCIMGGCNLVRGVGERVSPLPNLSSDYTIVLVKPNVSLSTAEVYRRFSNLSPEQRYPMGDINALCEWLESGSNGKPSQSWFQNSLEAVTAEEFNIVRIVKEELAEMGAMVSFMTGHGPTVVGLFAHHIQEETIRSKFDGCWTGVARSCLMKWNSV